MFPEATRGPHVVACLPTAALSLGRARPDAVAAGIQADVTGECALEAIDRAMHGAGSARLSDVEPDIVTVAVAAFQPPQIGSDLEARKRAIEVRPCPLCKMFACVLPTHGPHAQVVSMAGEQGCSLGLDCLGQQRSRAVAQRRG